MTHSNMNIFLFSFGDMPYEQKPGSKKGSVRGNQAVKFITLIAIKNLTRFQDHTNRYRSFSKNKEKLSTSLSMFIQEWSRLG